MGKETSLPRSWRAWLLGGLTAAAPIAVASALAADSMAQPPLSKNSTTHAKASLICEQTALTPGSTTTLGITFEIQPKWHLYWNGRNDNGVPPKAEFDLPSGYTVDAIQWPAPVRHVEPGDMLNHVYFDRVTLLVPLHVPSSSQPGSTVTLKANVSWLVCESMCVGEEAALQIKIPIAERLDKVTKSPDAKLIDQARARIPQVLPPDSKDVRFSWSKDAVKVNAIGASSLLFYPDEDCIPFAEPIKDTDKPGSSMAIRLGDPEKDHPALTGVLEIRREKGKPAEFYHLRSTAAPSNTTPDPKLVPTIPNTPNTPKIPKP